mmetsp:Transcript_55679/g.110561  ORF Transcript_55679/g.110561 Transcript_55679/m.110561 type:complete len:421 (-) Transcript_55679:211-1473(-)
MREVRRGVGLDVERSTAQEGGGSAARPVGCLPGKMTCVGTRSLEPLRPFLGGGATGGGAAGGADTTAAVAVEMAVVPAEMAAAEEESVATAEAAVEVETAAAVAVTATLPLGSGPASVSLVAEVSGPTRASAAGAGEGLVASGRMLFGRRVSFRPAPSASSSSSSSRLSTRMPRADLLLPLALLAFAPMLALVAVAVVVGGAVAVALGAAVAVELAAAVAVAVSVALSAVVGAGVAFESGAARAPFDLRPAPPCLLRAYKLVGSTEEVEEGACGSAVPMTTVTGEEVVTAVVASSAPTRPESTASGTTERSSSELLPLASKRWRTRSQQDESSSVTVTGLQKVGAIRLRKVRHCSQDLTLLLKDSGSDCEKRASAIASGTRWAHWVRLVEKALSGVSAPHICAIPSTSSSRNDSLSSASS